jgi:cytochrome oxidase Cu insertion factor (SCO1/SenC/PrrC family)
MRSERAEHRRRPSRLGAPVALALAMALHTPAAHEGHKLPPAGVRGPYAFPIAGPGTYRLPPIKRAAGGPVLDETGRRHDLADLVRGRIAVVAFIYTRCGDVCPAATLDMSQLQDLAAKDRHLAGRMRLITMSFDPEHDRPEVMREFAAQWRSGEPASPEWLFLTAPDRETVAPMLAAYNQQVDRKPHAASPGGPLNHIFRAFLIDREGLIRNIYSFEFFDPKLVLNDVQTVLVDRAATPRGSERAPRK